MILKRPCSETYKKQWFISFFWSLLFRNNVKTMICLVFLVSGKLFESRREGQEFLKKQKTEKALFFYRGSEKWRPEKQEKTLFFIRFLKRHAQKHLKNNGFSSFSGRYFSETLYKQCFFRFFWFLGNSLEAGGKDKSFSKTRKNIINIVFIGFLKSSDHKNHKQYCFYKLSETPCSETLNN